MEDEKRLRDYQRWFAEDIVLWNISRCISHRASAFGYSDYVHRPVRLYSMESIRFLLERLKAYAPDVTFWVTTEQYDWRMAPSVDEKGHLVPPLIKGTKEERDRWRAEIWNPLLNTEGFVTGKDLVFELDCDPHWEDGVWVAQQLVEALPYRTVWVVYSGSGGFHVWVPWQELKSAYCGPMIVRDLAEWVYYRCGEVMKELGATKTPGGWELEGVQIHRTPTTPQGLIRCPYSIHPKTGHVALPLGKKMFWALRDRPSPAPTPEWVFRFVKNRGMPNVVR